MSPLITRTGGLAGRPAGVVSGPTGIGRRPSGEGTGVPGDLGRSVVSPGRAAGAAGCGDTCRLRSTSSLLKSNCRLDGVGRLPRTARPTPRPVSGPEVAGTRIVSGARGTGGRPVRLRSAVGGAAGAGNRSGERGRPPRCANAWGARPRRPLRGRTASGQDHGRGTTTTGGMTAPGAWAARGSGARTARDGTTRGRGNPGQDDPGRDRPSRTRSTTS